MVSLRYLLSFTSGLRASHCCNIALTLKDGLGMTDEQVAALRGEKVIPAPAGTEVGQAAVA